MVGHLTVTKPSRSDEVLDADQQRNIANQIKAQFDSLAPKRPSKPNRSEPDLVTPAVESTTDQNIPELHKLRSLQSQSHGRFGYSVEGEYMVGDEFVETQYYKELVSIDKQHHTTGTGFIKAVKEGCEENGFSTQLGGGYGGGDMPPVRSNPATNDWIPSVEEDHKGFVSSKPNRSESCY